MSFWDYVYSKTVTLCFLGIGALLAGAFLAFAEVSAALIGMMAAVFCFLVILWLLAGYLSVRSRLKKLQSMLEELPEKYLLGELLQRPDDAVEYQY